MVALLELMDRMVPNNVMVILVRDLVTKRIQLEVAIQFEQLSLSHCTMRLEHE